MKRLALIPVILLLLSLCACSVREETTDFYYLRSKFVSGAADGVIAPEPRAISGDRERNYCLRLYLEGPASEQYLSPFPKGLRLLSTKLEEDLLQVYLSPELSALKDMDLTLACACLAQTCFDLYDVQRVQIFSGDAEDALAVTLDRASFTLSDSDPTTP